MRQIRWWIETSFDAPYTSVCVEGRGCVRIWGVGYRDDWPADKIIEDLRLLGVDVVRALRYLMRNGRGSTYIETSIEDFSRDVPEVE